MKEEIILIIAGVAGWLGIKYKGVYDVVKKLSFMLAGFSIDKLTDQSLTISFAVSVANPTNKNLTIKNSSINCYMNSTYAGKAFIPYSQIARANSTTKIIIATTINYRAAFSDWWNLFLSASTSIRLVLAGSIRFDGVLVPIPAIEIADFTIADAVKKVSEL